MLKQIFKQFCIGSAVFTAVFVTVGLTKAPSTFTAEKFLWIERDGHLAQADIPRTRTGGQMIANYLKHRKNN